MIYISLTILFFCLFPDLLQLDILRPIGHFWTLLYLVWALAVWKLHLGAYTTTLATLILICHFMS